MDRLSLSSPKYNTQPKAAALLMRPFFGVCQLSEMSQLSEMLTLVIDGVRMGTMMVPCKGPCPLEGAACSFL